MNDFTVLEYIYKLVSGFSIFNIELSFIFSTQNISYTETYIQ